MTLSAKKTEGYVSYKVDEKSGKLICLECKKPMDATKVVDGRLVCRGCAKKLKEGK